MGTRDGRSVGTSRFTRRDVIRTGVGTAGAAALGGLFPSAGGAAPWGGPRGAASGRWVQDGGSITFLSTQLRPVEEAEKMRGTILADFPGEVEFLPEEEGPFNDRLAAEAQAGAGTIGVVGGQHGDFATLAEQGLLADLTELTGRLADRGFDPQYLELAKLGGTAPVYVPWMQAMYVMAAHRDALEYLPDGVDESALQTSLTYDQVGVWAKNINDAGRGQKFGLPAGEKGLLHRFFQGYSYPSFTGALNTKFKSPEAVQMWQWLKDTWANANPQSLNYEFMQTPLLAGEVWVAWDHTARLIDALRTSAEDFVVFPAPRGPQGLGFMPVVAGLAIPKNAPDTATSESLIEYLTRPEIQAITLREVAFFPTGAGELPTDLEPGVKAEADAISATTSSEQALPSLLPVGLGDQNGAYNKVFRDAFQRIVLDGEEIQTVLDAEAANLTAVLDTAQAACWQPDPASTGVCPVG